jgi:hypothetical protein
MKPAVEVLFVTLVLCLLPPSAPFWISSRAAEQTCGGHAAPEFDTILVTGESH